MSNLGIKVTIPGKRQARDIRALSLDQPSPFPSCTFIPLLFST